jgi:Ca2+-transporting ATPase
MARRRAIVRKLPAVETLGSTTVICSDKTGTLTENQMTVQLVALAGSVFTVTGAGYDPAGVIANDDGAPGVRELLLAGLLCNDSSVYLEEGEWRISGDPTEAALLVSAAKAGLNRDEMDRLYPRIDTVPFESEHQYMATLHSLADGDAAATANHRAYIKGAVEKILDRCNAQSSADGQIVPLDRAWAQEQAEEMASQGLRVLAFASKDFPAPITEISHHHIENDLVFLGLQGMIDPPRGEAIEAVKACHTAGIEVRMITGDHALTAAAIARRLNLKVIGAPGLADPRPLTGAQLAAMDDDALAETIRDTYVFARVTPEQKLRLVTALQRHGHVVAMTGDGVNDAPALRQADIGIAMGITGTEVAKEAADMVLTDDNFASIEAAVEEGRGVFDNITKFITWTLPTNLGEGLVILAAIFAGVALPILPVQILWINMTTAVLLGLMLAFEPKESGIMERPPRPPRAPLLSSMLIGRVAIVGVLLLAGAFVLFEWAQQSGHPLAQSRTIAANVFVFGELFYLFNCRSLLKPSWHSRLWANKFLLAGVGLMIALQLLYTYAPAMNELFGSAPISLGDWGWILVTAAAVHVLIEVEKWIHRRRQAARE